MHFYTSQVETDCCLMLRHQRFHNKCIDFLTAVLPVGAHQLGLFLVGNRDVKIDQRAFAFPDLAVYDVILAGGFVKIRDDANFIAHLKTVFLEVLVHITDDGGGDILAKEAQRLLAFFCNCITGAVVGGLRMDQTGFLQFAQSLLQRKIAGIFMLQEKIG